MAEAVARRAPGAVVAHLDPQLLGRVAEGHLGGARVRVLERVGQPLLDDAVRGEVDRARERERLALDVEPDGQAGSADLVRERLEPVEPGLRRELDLVPVLAHGLEEAAHLDERGAAGLLDALERLAVLIELGGKLVPYRSGLEDHDADRVGDDVVQLARDPGALLGHRDPRRGVALALGLERAVLGGLGHLRALAHGDPREPAEREEERDEDELGRVGVRCVVDDRPRAEEDDREPDARAQ